MGERGGGAVLLARALMDSEVWGMPERYIKLWVYLLLSVRWDATPYRIGPVTVKYGQVVKSYRKMAEECEWTENQRVRRWSTSQVKRMVEWFEEHGMVKTLGTDLGTLIEVTQFEKWQDFATYAAVDLGTDLGTPAEHLRNNRKQEETTTTDNPPTPLDPAARAVSEMCRTHDLTWKLKASIEAWTAQLRQDYPNVNDLPLEIRKCSEYWEGQRRKLTAPNQAIHNWLKNVRTDDQRDDGRTGGESRGTAATGTDGAGDYDHLR